MAGKYWSTETFCIWLGMCRLQNCAWWYSSCPPPCFTFCSWAKLLPFGGGCKCSLFDPPEGTEQTHPYCCNVSSTAQNSPTALLGHSRHPKMRCFQQHFQVQILGVKALNPTVFMTRWTLTLAGAVQCFTTVPETLGRFLEYDTAPWPQLGSLQAAGCERLNRAQIQLRYPLINVEFLFPNRSKCKPQSVSSGFVVYNNV